ncbi:helix-turn-helix transcriptional regulator [Jannaschia sp. CCS1]|uniref:helix-turn-helix transcriptional regulator n=1 Tax=Jannaschia sp. (strain CCS1) TaxID=290400 RepID=UPI000053D7BB|nr:helix-turn-helix transcriptional regulator [Jannaschia sp. CCS1]ABD53592.1 transcriptional regulator, XRE family with shikimate kinase activity [Jannaschia sp. CCS1]
MSSEDRHPPVAIDAAILALQARVGDRVRAARASKRISRRVLSETSGVSPRYLAQLEGGDGNISIGLLFRVADALDVSLEALVSACDLPADARRVGQAFADADPVIQARVRDLLSETTSRDSRLCLIGLRGAGKSTLGAAAAKALDVPFIELNRAIEAAGSMPIAEIMALYGAEGYRQLEADALDKIVAEQDRAIVAVAGGIVGEAKTFDRLLDRFHTVWVKTSPEEHMSRVRAQGDTRPMEGNPQAMAQLRLILTSREADYSRANAVLDTGGQSVDASLAGLLSLIEHHNFITKDLP